MLMTIKVSRGGYNISGFLNHFYLEEFTGHVLKNIAPYMIPISSSIDEKTQPHLVEHP